MGLMKSGQQKSKKMMMTAIILLLLSFTAFAQDGNVSGTEDKAKQNDDSAKAKEDQKVLNLDEVVVTATRTEKKIMDAPASVDVITREDIESQNVFAIDGAFNTVSGFNTRREEGIVGLEPVVCLRGIPGGSRTLFITDGIVLNDPRVGSAYLDGLAPEDVERIEVVKGPFSSLYGGYAMGGVVNVVTKIPEERSFTLKTGYGSSWDRGNAWDDMRSVYASGTDKIGKLGLLASYKSFDANGYPLQQNIQSSQPPADITGWSLTGDREGKTRYLIGDKGDQTVWNDSAKLKASYDFTDFSNVVLTFMRTSNGYDYDEPHTYMLDESNEPVWTYGSVKETTYLPTMGGKDRYIYGMNFETLIADVKTKATFSYIDVAESWYTSPGSSAPHYDGAGTISDSPSKSFNSDIQFTLPPFYNNNITLGVSYRQSQSHTKNQNLVNWRDEDSITSLYYETKGKDRTFSVFTEDEISILDNLTGYVGLRGDWWETYDGYADDIGKTGYPVDYESRDVSNFSPKLALVYKPMTRTTLRVSGGKAFRPPTIYELYYTYTSGSTNSTTTANKDLEPEKNTSWDAGVRQELWKGAAINVTYYENYIEDLIYTKTISSTLKERVNVGEAETKGVEVEVEQRFSNGLKLYGNLSHTDSEITENDANPDTVGKELTDLPEWVFNIGGQYENGPFSVSMNGRYVDHRYSTDLNTDTEENVYGSYDSYFLVDAKLAYALTDFASISLAVDNMFDEDYYYYYKAPGRSYFISLTLTY